MESMSFFSSDVLSHFSDVMLYQLRVLLAVNTITGVECAIKIVDKDRITNTREAEQLAREVFPPPPLLTQAYLSILTCSDPDFCSSQAVP
jgi:hypothetical protein